ncbi:MAG: hypothetical protein ACE5G8_13095 [Anaerolineae bacterium]
MSEDILKAFMSSGDSKPENQQDDDNPLAGLAGSLLGGGGAEAGANPGFIKPGQVLTIPKLP